MKNVNELYFAINKNTGDIFNSTVFYSNKISWAKLGHLKGIFKRNKLNEEDYKIYRISVSDGTPMLFKIKE